MVSCNKGCHHVALCWFRDNLASSHLRIERTNDHDHTGLNDGILHRIGDINIPGTLLSVSSSEDDLAASGYPHGTTPYERQFIREESE